MAVKNLYSLGLLRNGKVYQNKELATQGLTQQATNDGVAKLARYISDEIDEESGKPLIKTLVGFYANTDEMEDNGGGQSFYTILDIEGSAADIDVLKEAVSAINEKIGSGFSDKTLTEAIKEVNAKLGEGFSEDCTVADALAALKSELEEKLAISLTTASDPGDYAKVYELKQGGNLIGTIDIPKDIVVKEGKLVYGKWEGDEFHENTEEIHYGDEPAIKLVLNNDDVIYINAKDLVDVYTAGDGIDLTDNVVSIKYNNHSEEFLVVDEDGIRVEGIQAAIDKKADEERLEASDGISIASNKVKAVAAGYSAPAIKNPITVDKDGIKFANFLDCGFFDVETAVVSTAEDINAITDPQNTDVFINGDEAFNAVKGKTFKNIEASDINAATETSLAANGSITLDNIEVTGDKGESNAFVGLNAPSVEISNATVADGSKAYNVFEQVGNTSIDSFSASNVKVDDVALAHNVFNVYRLENSAVINISDVNLNLNVNNSNALRLANCTNATGVTVNFENVAWTYENTPNKDAADWGWAGLIIYQPYSTDVALGGDLDAMKTWTFNFKNCKYNGVKVTANNFGEHNQVFYMYNVGGDGSIKDPVANGLILNFA